MDTVFGVQSTDCTLYSAVQHKRMHIVKFYRHRTYYNNEMIKYAIRTSE